MDSSRDARDKRARGSHTKPFSSFFLSLFFFIIIIICCFFPPILILCIQCVFFYFCFFFLISFLFLFSIFFSIQYILDFISIFACKTLSEYAPSIDLSTRGVHTHSYINSPDFYFPYSICTFMLLKRIHIVNFIKKSI